MSTGSSSRCQGLNSITLRTRKFLGTFAVIAYLIAYSLCVMALGGQYIVGRGLMFELPFYAAAGFLWLPGSMAIIRWMSRPDKTG